MILKAINFVIIDLKMLLTQFALCALSTFFNLCACALLNF